MTLRIPCTADWFRRVKNGENDYRPTTSYWCKRIDGKIFDTITFTLGYPKADDADRHYVIPFYGIKKTKDLFVISTKPLL